jgi:hypothetical protein
MSTFAIGDVHGANDPAVDREGWPHPRISGRSYGVDTISRGVLTAVRLPEGVVIQSDRHA